MTSATNRTKEVRPSASKASLSGRDAQPRSPRLTYSYPTIPGRFPATPALPPSWTTVHDRAICVLDACDYSLNATVKKLRSAFPELAGSVLTAVMVDKRLRTLDQNPSIDFFRIGLEHLLLTRDDEEGISPVSRAKLEEKVARVDHGDATPSMPSFPSVSTGRQNSMNESLPFKVRLIQLGCIVSTLIDSSRQALMRIDRQPHPTAPRYPRLPRALFVLTPLARDTCLTALLPMRMSPGISRTWSLLGLHELPFRRVNQHPSARRLL